MLIAGDALCTYNPLTGERGPQLLPQRVRRRQRCRCAARWTRSSASTPALHALRPRRALDRGPAAAVARAVRVGLTSSPPILMTRREVAPALEHGNAHLRAPPRGRRAAHRPPPRGGGARPLSLLGIVVSVVALGGVVWWAIQQHAPHAAGHAGARSPR